MSSSILKHVKSIYGRSKSTNGQNESILIRDGLIDQIGHLDDMMESLDNKELRSIKILDCNDFIALPGFVESHTHLLFAGSREGELYMRAEGRPYLDILESGGGIHSTVNAVREASEEQLLKNGLKFLDHALKFGITTVEIKSGYGLDTDTERKMLQVIRRLDTLHPVDVIPTFLVHTVPKGVDRKNHIETVAKEMIPQFQEYAQWFDIFLEKNVFELDESEFLIGKALEAGYHIGLHTNQVNDIGGVGMADRMGIRHVDHLETLSDEDADRIRQNEDLFAVFLPTAEGFVFSEHVGQIHKLLDVPERLVLSSDFNPGSSPVLSPFFVMAYAVLRYRLTDPHLIVDAFTTNPAKMLYLDDRGMITPGKKADIVLLELDNFQQIPYWGTIDFVKHVIKDGRVQSII